MKTRIGTHLEKLRGSYWVIPALMVTTSILFSFITIHIDQTASPRLLHYLGWLGVEDPDGARTFLSVVAGSMIGTTGVTFSITIASLVQASAQLGPRLLNNFLRDRGNQFVLGTFTATYTYCLFILKSINNIPDQAFVPNLSLTVSIVLTILSLTALVYFFHHISTSLQADHVITQVGEQLTKAIENLFPEKMKYSITQNKTPEDSHLPQMKEDSYEVKSSKSGYLQAIETSTLIEIAEKEDLTMQAEIRPGDFIAEENTLITIWPRKERSKELEEKIEEAFILGDQRLRLQDVKYHLEQLVEIAVRALSPGINDPFTAMNCIDQIAASLSQLMERSIPTGYNYDSQGNLRLVTKPFTFTDIIETSFNQIRRNGASSVSVTLKLLDAISLIAPHTRTWEQRETLTQQADLLNLGSSKVIRVEYDKEKIREKYRDTLKTLKK